MIVVTHIGFGSDLANSILQLLSAVRLAAQLRERARTVD
jgi:hypothetical protein